MVSTADETLRRAHAIPLVPSLHNHAWGETGSNSLAARLFCFQPGRGTAALRSKEHYSEICLGTHPSTPTRLATAAAAGRTLLDHVRTEVIEVDPAQVEHYAYLHRAGLPFLLKMVSVASPQAVHVHPDDADSARLHAIRPDAYPDPVGKAELTVAVSPVDALFGFRAPGEIVKELARVPEFADAVGRAATDKFVKEVRTGRGGAESLEELFGAFVSADEAKRSACLYAAVRRLEQMPDGSLSSDDTLLLRLHVAFPADPMCFAVYFLNLVRLEPGSAVFVPPKVPHAYLSGDIIEVSTCSTNVARAGLTDEALDLKEFCNNLTYDVSLVKSSRGEPKDEYTTAFMPSITEFLLYKYDIPSGRDHHIAVTLAPTLLACVAGQGFLLLTDDASGKMIPISAGSMFYLKAGSEFILSCTRSKKGVPSSPLLAFRVGINESSVPANSCVIV